MKIKLSDFIAKRLKQIYGVKDIFMISGGGAMHLNDSFGKYLNYICNHNEQASSIAAEGYSRLKGNLAVVSVTTGPGGINALNGVFGQWTDSVPVLYISGQVKTSTTLRAAPNLNLRQLGDQEVDIISVVSPLTKFAFEVTDPLDIQYALDKAVYLAAHGRKGPVWLDIPLDVQNAVIDTAKLKKYNPSKDELPKKNIAKQVKEVKELLKKSKKPVIIAGHGIRLADAQKDFLQMISRTNIPVVTTINGFDIIETDNKNFIGRIGTVGNRASNFVLQNADLVLSLGSRNNIRQISYNWENYAKNAKLILVDIDSEELKKPTLNPYLTINADCKDFIKQLSPHLNSAATVFEPWYKWCANIKKKYPPLTEAPRVKHNPIEPYAFVNTLTKCFSKGEIIVGGNGAAFLLPFQVGEVKKDQRYIWNSGNASMGYDLPAAIGATVAAPEKRVICLAGDGSIMMNIQELQTIKHHNLNLKVFILNNGGYNSIQQTQANFFEGRRAACCNKSGVTMPDFIKVAGAFGLKAVKIKSKANLDRQIKNVLKTKGPVICEVMLSAGYVFAPKLSARILGDGKMVSPSLEDMHPFLPKEEMDKNKPNL